VPAEATPAETARKIIHLGSLVFPASLVVLPEPYGRDFIYAATAGALLIEASRRLFPSFNRFFTGTFSSLLRPRECQKITDATWLLLSSCAIMAFLPLSRCSLILSQHIVGDAAAALVGQRWGKHKIGLKSLEGSLTYLAGAWLVFLFYRWQIIGPQNVVLFLGLGILFTILELVSSRGRDNLYVPILGGLSYKLFW